MYFVLNKNTFGSEMAQNFLDGCKTSCFNRIESSKFEPWFGKFWDRHEDLKFLTSKNPKEHSDLKIRGF